MKISIVVPSNRTDGAAIGRILEWATFDSARFELVVRDNSGDAQKRAVLENMNSNGALISFVETCDASTNFQESMSLATGDYVMWCGDDDRLFPDGLIRLHDALSKNHEPLKEDLVAIGNYFIEDHRRSSIFSYPNFSNENKNKQLLNYIQLGQPNFLFYSILSRSMVSESIRFTKSLPCFFSFTDQIIVLLHLIRARLIQIDQVFFGYNMNEWSTYEKAIQKDRNFYVNAGFDGDIDVLHHLLRGLEGFMLLNSRYATQASNEKLIEPAKLWLSQSIRYFLADENRCSAIESKTFQHVNQIKRNLANSKIINPRNLFNEVVEVMAISNHQLASKYHEFWLKL